MTTAIQTSVYAQAALAAYASELVASGDNTDQYTDVDRMSASQATQFNATWNVVQQSAYNVNGFSAVLLQNRNTAEKVLAIAGTDPSSPGDLITDLANIDLYGTVLGMPQYSSLEAFYAELVSTGKLAASEAITVTCHSLGGFLAQAFTAIHANVVSAAYTYNAPGFGSIESLLGFLGVADTSAASKIVNVHAADGPSFTAGLGWMLGASQGVRIEANTANPTDNHSVVRLGDALAVYAVYASLQPNLTLSELERQFLANGYGDRRVEDALDALRTVFIGSASNDVNKTPTSDRDRLYFNIKSLQDDASFQALSGQVQLVQTNTGFASLAQADTQVALAYRYALLELLPFAVVASSEAANQTLYSTYAQRLSLFDEATGQGELTTAWLADRASMLDWVVVRNTKNLRGVISASTSGRPIPESLNFQDLSDGTQLLIGTADQLNQRVQVVFGSADGETIDGFGRSDRLYGGAGNDVLNGLGGNDYLEVNADDDTLDGGDGSDTLLGGSGVDILIGGAGADVLKGGLGNDIYQFNAGFGHDTIIDAGGLGELKFGTAPISGGKKVAGLNNVWEDELREYVFTQAPGASGGNDLIIGRRTAAGSSAIEGTITVRGWVNGQLGITLSQDVLPTAPIVNVFNGGFIKKLQPDGITYSVSAGNYVADGVDPNAADLLFSGSNADQMQGGAGNDALAGNAGDDQLDGGDGSDVLLGGSGADRLFGGAGNDFIAGSGSYAGFVAPTRTTDALPAAQGVELARGFGWVAYDPPGVDGNGIDTYVVTMYTGQMAGDAGNTIDAGAGDDRVDAGTGSDIVMAGAGHDVVDGMDGADVIFGEDGDDQLWGDGTLLSGYLSFNDKYVLGLGYGAELVQENDATAGNSDLMQFMAGVAIDQIWFRQLANDLEISIIGTADKSTLQNWYLGSQYRLEQFKTSDGKTLLDSQVQNLVSAMASFTPPAVGQTTLPAGYQSTLLPVIAANWGP